VRVAVLINKYLPVSETFILAQITGLIERGHEVDIFAIAPTPPEQTNRDALRPDLAARVRYLYAPRGFRPGLRAALKSAAVLGRRPSVLARALNVPRYRRDALSLNLLRSAASIVQADRGGRYDIIHAQFGPQGLAAVRLREVGVLTGRIVTSFRGYDATADLGLRAASYRRLFFEADLFCPVSESLKRLLIAAGCDPEKITVLPSGVDCRRFTYTTRQRHSGEATRLLTVARLIEKKGLGYAIQAVARLARDGKSVSYVIAGDGPLRSSLEELVESTGLKSRVQFLGWVEQEQIRRLLEDAHILVAPSVTAQDGDQEGIPNVLKEAMATGLPVVSTHHSGIPELVQNGVSGFLVAERDVEALAERLAFLIDHPETWPELGRAGRRKVEAGFDVERLNDRLVALYAKLLELGASPPAKDRGLAVAR
jgi:colanic acid/amylovoran biosynthesis glycosyltransferase